MYLVWEAYGMLNTAEVHFSFLFCFLLTFVFYVKMRLWIYQNLCMVFTDNKNTFVKYK